MPKLTSRAAKRNPIAASLRSGHLRPKVIPSKRAYKRHRRTPERAERGERPS
jgi:hypothetical protein